MADLVLGESSADDLWDEEELASWVREVDACPREGLDKIKHTTISAASGEGRFPGDNCWGSIDIKSRGHASTTHRSVRFANTVTHHCLGRLCHLKLDVPRPGHRDLLKKLLKRKHYLARL